VEEWAGAVRKRFPDAEFAFNWSSSFKWYLDKDPMTFAELGDLGFTFVAVGADTGLLASSASKLAAQFKD
jgi:isocitrate lyase